MVRREMTTTDATVMPGPFASVTKTMATMAVENAGRERSRAADEAQKTRRSTRGDRLPGYDVVALLLQARATNGADWHGDSPASLAARQGHAKVCALLQAAAHESPRYQQPRLQWDPPLLAADAVRQRRPRVWSQKEHLGLYRRAIGVRRVNTPTLPPSRGIDGHPFDYEYVRFN